MTSILEVDKPPLATEQANSVEKKPDAEKQLIRTAFTAFASSIPPPDF